MGLVQQQSVAAQGSSRDWKRMSSLDGESLGVESRWIWVARVGGSLVWPQVKGRLRMREVEFGMGLQIVGAARHQMMGLQVQGHGKRLRQIREATQEIFLRTSKYMKRKKPVLKSMSGRWINYSSLMRKIVYSWDAISSLRQSIVRGLPEGRGFASGTRSELPEERATVRAECI